MDLFILKLVIVLIATGISAYTDFKTGYIYDWLTYPFIAIGLVFTFVEGTYVMGLLFAALIFLFGILLYYKGKIGGGDIKLFAGLALYFPVYNGYPFVLIVLFVSAFIALLIYGTIYLYYLIRNPPKQFYIYLTIFILISVIITILFRTNIYFSIVLFYFMIISLISLTFKDIITKANYKEEISVKELLDDDLADLTFMNKGEMVPLDKKLFEEIKSKLKETDKIVVYRNLPIFGPFIFLGIILTMILLYYFPVISFII